MISFLLGVAVGVAIGAAICAWASANVGDITARASARALEELARQERTRYVSESHRYEIVVTEVPGEQFAPERYRWEVFSTRDKEPREPIAVGYAVTRADADVKALSAVAMIRRSEPQRVVVSG